MRRLRATEICCGQHTLRSHHRGRRFGRLRTGAPSLGGPLATRAVARSRRRGPSPLVSDARRYRPDPYPEGRRLGLSHRARPRPRAATAVVAAGPRSRRFLITQRDVLRAGATRGLRCVGRPRAGLGFCICPALFSEGRASDARRRSLPWDRRPPHRLGSAPCSPTVTCLHRGLRRARLPAQ